MIITKEVVEFIDIEKRWVRNCPQCNDEIIYINKYKLKTAVERNTRCNKCWRFGKKFVETSEYKKLCPNCGKVVYFSNKYTLSNSIKSNAICNACIDRGNNGRKQSDEEKERRAVKLRGSNCL